MIDFNNLINAMRAAGALPVTDGPLTEEQARRLHMQPRNPISGMDGNVHVAASSPAVLAEAMWRNNHPGLRKAWAARRPPRPLLMGPA